jgi:membrane fusion protein
VIAEQGGKLTAMAVPEGQSVGAGQVLASIGYIGGDVEAVVYVPSRVAGKLYEDQEILLSFDAFDFHQYGRYPARIKQISAASLDPREQLLPVPDVREPVFRLTAEVEQRYVQGPQLYPLQAGLLFTADFVIEELPLLHFVLKPVLTMRGLVE